MKRSQFMDATSAGRSLRVLVTSAMLFAVLAVTTVVISPSAALAAMSVRHGDAKELFYIFRDGTTGKETYPAGRFLYSAMPKDGTVTLDFNKAYNPPSSWPPSTKGPGGRTCSACGSAGSL